MAKDDMLDGDLPDRDRAKDFYAKYEPKEALGKESLEVFYIKTPDKHRTTKRKTQSHWRCSTSRLQINTETQNVKDRVTGSVLHQDSR
ncbi:hypothetical protein FSP39_024310 [Pinctada imbricata]|uniref:Uncharacterized protein n=1 Tax=Pinctada imbricata TaxID=66713 RepID=A0AA88XLV4_PINIB|nr:hypothetical protein FSP39_024310 [Pinctada imbricata]